MLKSITREIGAVSYGRVKFSMLHLFTSNPQTNNGQELTPKPLVNEYITNNGDIYLTLGATSLLKIYFLSNNFENNQSRPANVILPSWQVMLLENTIKSLIAEYENAVEEKRENPEEWGNNTFVSPQRVFNIKDKQLIFNLKYGTYRQNAEKLEFFVTLKTNVIEDLYILNIIDLYSLLNYIPTQKEILSYEKSATELYYTRELMLRNKAETKHQTAGVKKTILETKIENNIARTSSPAYAKKYSINATNEPFKGPSVEDYENLSERKIELSEDVEENSNTSNSVVDLKSRFKAKAEEKAKQQEEYKEVDYEDDAPSSFNEEDEDIF